MGSERARQQVSDALDTAIRIIQEITDPLDRVKAATDSLTQIKSTEAEASRIRRDALDELITSGKTQAEIAKALDISDARLSQIRKSGPPPERAFFGATTQPVIAAVAEKREANKTKPGPVVSIDDLQAYNRLRGMVEDLGLSASYEVIKPPGNIALNRNGLVIICGPRHSWLISQVLGADDKLAFEEEEGIWHLVDRETGVTYRSPEDSGEPGDIAYLGRLPRPDHKGHFLYIAGIHAAGAAGAVHYLESELSSLYREVRNRRFSMLISCRYNPETHQIVSSQRITPIYKHEG
ncbi:hypothetical protein ACU635_43295 [[Actinomadura] parvosata]|uniref:hypothetical protein n=1 Tax=[Actinomadura] parvosata TaxID=1955412 RepID=UPI00406C2F58